ncbi:MAG: acetate/propionate family kinase [Bacillota bacterium]|jgi:acetate kinase|nr:acetate kinase [Bacillota bacterium]HOC05871.1 acetate kinase [Bacillota bacterium]HPZ21680.1 acetate kinase [Bacillota bacterium]HQD19517.1 acetate kinase [Bacillota bacterium]
MEILVINCGSSSLKYQLFDMEREAVMAKGLVERIGIAGSRLIHSCPGKDEVRIEKPLESHKQAISLVLETLTHPEHGPLESFEDIDAIGHRVVHGGEAFARSVKIDSEVMEAIKRNIDLAPLHNPPNIMGIEACAEILPGVPQVAVFDTAFHQTMPDYAYIYGLPYELYKEHGIRRYGFHGTSHQYVAHRAAALVGKPLEELKIITCHLGNGASITAVQGGKSVETSMGFTPLEGLIMGTRSGDIDPAIIIHMLNYLGMTADEVNKMLNKKSGVYGISGVSSDFRDLEQAEEEGNWRAALAMKSFYHRVVKYIGAYAAVMNGADIIVFTAGLGENSDVAREEVCKNLGYLGVEIDKKKNGVRGKEAEISTDSSRVKVFVIPTNEELMIARDTAEIAGA